MQRKLGKREFWVKKLCDKTSLMTQGIWGNETLSQKPSKNYSKVESGYLPASTKKQSFHNSLLQNY